MVPPLATDTGGGRLDHGDGEAEGLLVTAVVTTFDRFEVATRAIESVLAQTYRPLEVIVVEDGSESGVEDWLVEEGHTGVRYVRHRTNRGLSSARNTGLALASGDYIAYLDDDDEWKAERLERQVGVLESLDDDARDRHAVIYCSVENRIDGAVASVIPPENVGNLRDAIMRDGPSTLPSACLFSRVALESVGGYDETLPSSVDHDIWMALASQGYRAVALDEPLVVAYDEFGESMVTDTTNRIEGVRLYVEKWRPTYREWFGPEEGERRAQRYFVRVVGRLAAAKLITGAFDEAIEAIEAIDNESEELLYPTAIVLRQVVEAALKRALPPRAHRTLASITRRLGIA